MDVLFVTGLVLGGFAWILSGIGVGMKTGSFWMGLLGAAAYALIGMFIGLHLIYRLGRHRGTCKKSSYDCFVCYEPGTSYQVVATSFINWPVVILAAIGAGICIWIIRPIVTSVAKLYEKIFEVAKGNVKAALEKAKGPGAL